MEPKSLARELVRAIRGKRSQIAFSRRLGYESNVVYTWEAGRRWPTAAETLRAAARAGVDVPAALERFYKVRPPWLDEVDPTTREGVARLLRELKGRTPIVRLAAATGTSRYAIARFLTGKAEPSLPEFLALVEASSFRLLDLLATMVDPTALPSAQEAWERLEAQRRTAYELPWTQAVVRAIELADYQALPEHRPGWVAARLGLAPELERPCFEVLAGAGEIRWDGARWILAEPMAVDTGRDAAAGRRLKAHWARVGLERVSTGAEGLFSYNVFAVSAADLERVRELHVGYFRALRALVAESAPAERVVVANGQLFSLDR